MADKIDKLRRWVALGAPRNTPPDIVETLNREINEALADPKLQEKAAVLGASVLRGSPADFAEP